MAKAISQYFKRIFDDYQVLVCVNPQDFTGTELIVHPDGRVEKTEIVGDEEIFEDLEADEFGPCSPLEFQLLLAKAWCCYFFHADLKEKTRWFDSFDLRETDRKFPLFSGSGFFYSPFCLYPPLDHLVRIV